MRTIKKVGHIRTTGYISVIKIHFIVVTRLVKKIENSLIIVILNLNREQENLILSITTNNPRVVQTWANLSFRNSVSVLEQSAQGESITLAVRWTQVSVTLHTFYTFKSKKYVVYWKVLWTDPWLISPMYRRDQKHTSK